MLQSFFGLVKFLVHVLVQETAEICMIHYLAFILNLRFYLYQYLEREIEADDTSFTNRIYYICFFKHMLPIILWYQP